MFYIINNTDTYNKSPEIDYGNGTTMQFKKGLYIFDTDTTSQRHWVHESGIEIDGIKYNIIKSSDHEVKIQAQFLVMKIEEMKNNSFNFFMPITYKRYVDQYNKLLEDYPEYII